MNYEQINQITKITFIAQVLNFNLNEGLAEKLFKHRVKNKGKSLCDELNLIEQIYDKCFEQKEDTVVEIYDIVQEYLDKISSVGVEDMKNISLLIEAYKKDSKSINGIVNKILK